MSNKNLISLTFIINGEEVEIDKVNLNQPLKVSVQKALKNSGNTGRSLSDWQVMYNDQKLDTSKKVQEFDLSDGDEVYVNLKAGKGGNGA